MHRELNLNFVTDGPIKVVRVVQGDTGRILIITLIDKAAGTITAARIYAHKPDGHEVYNNCTIQNGEIIVTLTSQMLAVIGDVICQLRITDANGYITSYAFILKVEKSYVDSSAIESSNEWKTLEAALGSVDQINALYESAFSAGRVVNSTSQMTDQSTTYILRSSGVIYYYNGTSWVPMTAYVRSNELTSYATRNYVDSRIGITVKKGLEASNAIAIGEFAVAGDADVANDFSLSIGNGYATINSIAIGNSIDCEAVNGAIQIGESETKADNGEFKVKDYQLMNANGKIPEARIPDSIINGTIKFVDHVKINTSPDGVYMTKSLEGSDGGIVDNKYFLAIIQTSTPFSNKNAIAFYNGKMYVSYGQEPKVAYSDVVDNSENAPTCQAVQNYVDSHSSSGWQKIADITVNSETAGVGTGAISVPLNDLKIKNANRFMVVIQPFTTEAKPANSITLNAYIRPETGTYYNLPIFNAPSNNQTTKANSLNYAMSVGDIANNGTADAIAMVISHGLTQYANINSDAGNTRHGTYNYNASRVDNSHLPFLHLIASGYEWEAGSKASLYIM